MAVRATRPGRLTAQDLALEAAERLARLDAELVQRGARVRVGLERLRRATGLVPCRHQQVPEALAQRMLDDERVELGDDVRRVAELDIGGDALLERDEAKLLEPPRLGLGPVLERELGERRPAPQLERADEERASLLGRRTARVREQPFEVMRVDLLALDLEHVPGWTRDEHVRAERLPQRDDRVLDRRRRRFRRVVPIELVDELLRRHDPPRTQQQGDEQRALSRPPESDRRLLVPHLERAEDPKAKASVRRL